MSKKLMYGKACNSKGEYPAYANGKNLMMYDVWLNMIKRCYRKNTQKKQPTYADCTVDDRWLDYQDFARWYDNHPNKNDNYRLDKDILFSGNKVYSPDTCCLVPMEINQVFLDSAAARGDLPQGVNWHKHTGKYSVRVGVDGRRRSLGYYDCPNKAYQVYKQAKEANVKRMALEWKDRIADDVFQALMNWQLTE